MPRTTLLALLLGACATPTSSPCLAGALAESSYCGDGGEDCIALAELSQGCIGSHTEQPCTSGSVAYTRTGGDDAATLFFATDGALAAVRRVGAGTGACADAWFGLDLSDCEATGAEVVVPCDGNGSGEG